MTSYDKVNKTLATLQGAIADLETLSLQTNDQRDKNLFEQMSINARDIKLMLESQIQKMQLDEPQYKEE